MIRSICWASLKVFLLILSSLFILLACQSKDEEHTPDVSHIQTDLQVNRFEQELFALDTLNLEDELPALEARYPEFSAIYFDRILRIPPRVNAKAEFIRGMVQHPGVQATYQIADSLYGDFSKPKKELEQALSYFQYYFPDRKVPDLTTFISEFSIAGFIYGDDQLAIGLDYFLGKDFPYDRVSTTDPAFSRYLTRTYTPEHLTRKTLQPLVDDVVGPPTGDRLIDRMIYGGKKLYLLDKLIPTAPDSILFQISADQADWIKENELEMWAYFLKEDLLYSTDWQRIRKYLDTSPSSPGMPPEAPGGTANYLGYQILRAYARRHPDIPVSQLMALEDAQKILTESRYKPAR